MLKLNDRGFTLVELLVGMAIMLIILAPIFGTLTTTIKTFQINMAQQRNISSEREIFNALSNEIRYATNVTRVSSTEIEFTVDNRNCRIFIGTGDNANALMVERIDTDGNTTTKNLTSAVIKNITFESVANKTLTVSIEVIDRAFSNSPIITFNEFTISLPNM
ncbi:PilW family protein [Sporomusa termitida]|uniref:Prepilin-type N-terminal cleavage/methylation domain-containing protein n=1 Tax=Sporomusa termitida TaxID=2377 RepID=A0A517DSB7_9FIRM|nr:prepilin-type N-terminal cleavage/methylation domain-containing protein [Sporomusa termitida]QDR80255.1 hypothetical protein SPTER_15740 [Sporomusa termitida]